MIYPLTHHEFKAMADVAASLCGKAHNTVMHSIKSGKEGVLYCVEKVSNTVSTMKKAANEGLSRLSGLWRSTRAASPVKPVPVKTPIDPVSSEFTREICQVMREEMSKDPAYLNHMFRREPTVMRSTLNTLLKDKDTFIKAIHSKEIDGVTMGFLIKEWSEQALVNNKFTADERKKLAAEGTTRAEVLAVFNGKFDLSQAGARENKAKLISLFSVMRAYKQGCDNNVHITGREFDSSVVDRVCITRLFNLSNTLDNVRVETEEAGHAITALLNHCPPGISSKPKLRI